VVSVDPFTPDLADGVVADDCRRARYDPDCSAPIILGALAEADVAACHHVVFGSRPLRSQKMDASAVNIGKCAADDLDIADPGDGDAPSLGVQDAQILNAYAIRPNGHERPIWSRGYPVFAVDDWRRRAVPPPRGAAVEVVRTDHGGCGARARPVNGQRPHPAMPLVQKDLIAGRKREAIHFVECCPSCPMRKPVRRIAAAVADVISRRFARRGTQESEGRQQMSEA
jgi:hypothetical protein